MKDKNHHGATAIDQNKYSSISAMILVLCEISGPSMY